MKLKSIYISLSLAIFSGSIFAAPDNVKKVNNVQWNKTTPVSVEQLLNKEIPNNVSSVFFLRDKKDASNVETSVNIAINDRFQVSLQSGNFSQVYTCVGVNQLSGQITGLKSNDLLKNALPFKFEGQVNYFFKVHVGADKVVSIQPVAKEVATEMMKTMNYQSHQISRVKPTCESTMVEPTVAPPPMMPVASPSTYENIELMVLFDTDKAVVKPQYYNEVKRVADFMQAHPTTTVTIEGHTDDRASAKYNVALSQRRVDAVKRVLIEKFNISPERLNAIGYGESRPVASNATAEGRQKNRRVVAVFSNY